MTSEQKEELKNFLIYLHLSIMADRDELNGEGYIALTQLVNDYPQFSDIRRENEKIFRWLDEENKQ